MVTFAGVSHVAFTVTDLALVDGEVYVADGHSYFNGSGPRLVDGLEILAEILHPNEFARKHRKGYFKWKIGD